MKSIKSVIKVVREWAQEICEEDDRRLFQRIDGVIADEERIYLHICDGNYFALESIDVRGGDGVQIFLTDIDHDKTCLYTLRECEDFEPIEYCMRGCPGSKFFTPDRLTELRRRIKDLLEIKEAKEKCKADNIKLVSDPNKRTALRPDSDIVEIVRQWACDICREKGFRISCTCDIDGVDFELIGPSSGITAVIENLGNGFDIVISDHIPGGGVAHVIYDATGEVDTAVSGSSKMITHEQVKDLVNRLRCINNSTPVKNSYSFSPNILELGLDKITPLTLTHDIIKHGHAMRRWCFDSSWISPIYDVVDANKQYRRRIDYLIDKFRRLSAEYGRAESALSKIPNIPLEEYCTHKFPIRRKLILPTVETIDGKTVMHFKVDDLSERVIKKYHNKPSILIDAVDKELNSKNSMFNIFDQGTCRPSDEVLCYVIENMASRNPYGIKAAPDNARNYCSLAKILVLLNISSAELKDLSEEERDDMAEYLRRHDSLVAYGSGSSVNGIILALMHHIDKAERTLEHDVVVIDNSSVLQAAVKITQLVNMLINCDITLGWMKRHKSSELEIDDPTLIDKVAACFRK